MAEENKTPAVQEPPVDERTGTEVLKSLTAAQTKKWRETGELPEVKAAEKTEPPKVEEKKEAAPAAIVEKKEPPAAEPPKVEAKPEEKRVTELQEENKRLLGELEAARKAVPTVAAPKGDAPAKPARNDVDPKTGLALYATDEAFEEAKEKWIFEKASRETRAELAKEDSERRVAEQNAIIERRLMNSIEIAKQKHADFDEVMKSEMKDGKFIWKSEGMRLLKGNGVLDARLLRSPISAELAYYFSKNPGEVTRIQSLADPYEQSDEVRAIELKLSDGAAPAKVEPPPAPPTKVPPSPAASVGGKATAPVDESEAAVEAGDFHRYQVAENAVEHRKRTVN